MLKLAMQSRLVPGDVAAREARQRARYGFDGIELQGFPMIAPAEEAVRDGVPVSAMCSGHRGWFIDPDPDLVRACLDDVKRLLELGARARRPAHRRAHLRPHPLPACRTAARAARPRRTRRSGWPGCARSTDHAERVGGRLLVEAINRYQNERLGHARRRRRGSRARWRARRSAPWPTCST